MSKPDVAWGDLAGVSVTIALPRGICSAVAEPTGLGRRGAYRNRFAVARNSSHSGLSSGLVLTISSTTLPILAII
jgi:hypothetical protein